jgi:F-box-like
MNLDEPLDFGFGNTLYEQLEIKLYPAPCTLPAGTSSSRSDTIKRDHKDGFRQELFLAMDKLPSEILLSILEQHSLPTSSIVALRQTCRRFRDACQPSKFDTSASMFETKGDKLEFLEMLCRDSPRTDLLACPAYLVLHAPSRYSQTELLKPPSQRQCLYRSKLLRCPHKYFFFNQWQ